MNVLIAALIMFTGTYRIPVKRLFTSPVLQEELNLSDSQVQQIKEEWFKTEPKLIDLRAQKAKIMLNIREELDKDVVDFDKLSKLYNELGSVDAKIRFARAKMLVNVKKVLTKDQIKKIKLMRHHRRNFRAYRRMWRRHHPMKSEISPRIER